MINLICGIFLRIFSNSYLNFFQKLLTSKGEKASVVNFYTYFGLSMIGIFFINIAHFSLDLIINTLLMGLLGALGNYYIIKALSIAELSSVAPINSYKPIVALIIGYLYLNELPSWFAFTGILLIIFGTYYLYSTRSEKVGISAKAVLYRILALIFSGTEAIFIKKVILLSDIPASFGLWAISGFIFTILFIYKTPVKIKITNIKWQILLIIFVCIMQLSTNYVFANMNVSCALALFQLSTILSVFLGVKLFNEKALKKKLLASIIMLIGAVIIIFS